jgi:hypothetical protein
MREPLILFSFLLTACGAGPQPATPWRVNYPADRFIVAEGQDTTPQAAADAARAGVAAQIASRIRASIEVESSEIKGRGAQSVRRRVATETGFEHAELIDVPPALTRCASTCSAVAVLDRQRALDTLRPAYDAAHARFSRAATAAEAQTNLSEQTLHLTAARQAHLEAEALAAPITVIGGAPPPERGPDRQMRRALDQRAEALLNATPVVLALHGVDADFQPALGRALVHAFAQLGLRAAPGTACTAGLSFVPHATVNCDRSALGPRCRLQLTGSLNHCDGTALTALDFSGTRLAAVHPRSRDHARMRLIERVSAAQLTETLRANLASVLPVQQ